MSKKRTKSRKTKKQHLRQKNLDEQKIKIIINDYSYFPPTRKEDQMFDLQNIGIARIQQIVKQHNLDIDQNKNYQKINQLLNQSVDKINEQQKLSKSTEEQDAEFNNSPVVKIFNCSVPYLPLEQLAAHYYFLDFLYKTKGPYAELLKKIGLKEININSFAFDVKQLIKGWNHLIPAAKKLLLDFLASNYFSRKEAAFWAGLMRDKPLLPILGSLMDLWFYPMLGHVKELDLAEEDFLKLIEKAWLIEEIMAQELLNKTGKAIINGIINPTSKLKLTYPLMQFPSVDAHAKILSENFNKAKNNPFGQQIFMFLARHSSLQPRLRLSLERFGAIGESVQNFINNLFVDPSEQKTLPDKNSYSKNFMTYLKQLKAFLNDNQEKIKEVIVNKKAPYYELLTYLLQCFTIRPALQGILYWHQFEEIPAFEKLFTLALKTEISYLKTLTNLAPKSFAAWFATTRYQE